MEYLYILFYIRTIQIIKSINIKVIIKNINTLIFYTIKFQNINNKIPIIINIIVQSDFKI